jgi:hypothetical protein
MLKMHYFYLFRQLKEILTNEIIEMIKPKRIHLLCKGQTFNFRILPKEKDKRVKRMV